MGAVEKAELLHLPFAIDQLTLQHSQVGGTRRLWNATIGPRSFEVDVKAQESRESNAGSVPECYDPIPSRL